jgi:glycolate oxidase iron-sulfur subunit
MQTHFTADQLADPQIVEADAILRKCVHCGFCTATCPTFVITGDERDSPRGRIWMLREVLESPETVSANTCYHIDRCLGCLSCTTTCPSGVITRIFSILVAKSWTSWCRGHLPTR